MALAQCRHAEGTEILKGKRLGLKTSNAKYGRGNMGSIEVFHQCSQPSLHDPVILSLFWDYDRAIHGPKEYPHD